MSSPRLVSATDGEAAAVRPESFWPQHAELVSWFRPPAGLHGRRGDRQIPGRPWFAGAVLNLCFNALDRQVIAGRGDQPALVFDPGTTPAQTTSFTYARLLEESAAVAGVLRNLGVMGGDQVPVEVSWGPEAALTLLACARVGALPVLAGPDPTARVSLTTDEAGHVVLRRRGTVGQGRPSQDPDLGADLEWGLCLRAGRSDPASVVDLDAESRLWAADHSGSADDRSRGVPGGPLVGGEDRLGALAVRLAWGLAGCYGVRPGEVWCDARTRGAARANARITHDDVTWGLWTPLLGGATCVVHTGRSDPVELDAMLARHGVGIALI